MKPNDEVPTKFRVRCVCPCCYHKWFNTSLKTLRNRAIRRRIRQTLKAGD